MDSGLLDTYTQKIADLQAEWRQSIWLNDRMFSEYNDEATASSTALPNLPIIDTSSVHSKRETPRSIRHRTPGRPAAGHPAD